MASLKAARVLLPLFALLVLVHTAASADRAPRKAPSFSLRGNSGTVCLDSLRGHVVLVDFWASWCGPCHQSFPWMAGMQKKYADQGLRVVAVNLDKTVEAAQGFLAATPAPFAIAYDPEGKVATAYRVEGMPTSVLVGRGGEILYSHVGFDPHGAQKLESLIQEACSR